MSQISDLEKLHPPPNLSDDERFQWSINYYTEIYEVLMKAQEEYGQRFHKGNPLYHIGMTYANKNVDEAVRYLLMAYIEDCITYSTKEIWNTFSVFELRYFGVGTEFLAAVRAFVLSKIQQLSFPQLILSECLDTKGISKALSEKVDLPTVKRTELDIQVSRLMSMLQEQIRPCFRRPPADERDLSIAVNALCTMIDPSYEKEVTIGRVLEKEFIVDFLLFDRKVGLELKVVKNSSDLAKVKDQLLTDLAAYVSLAFCIFLVYDAGGVVDDVTKLEDEIKLRNKSARLVVVKH
jgi:hypothetical protein